MNKIALFSVLFFALIASVYPFGDRVAENCHKVHLLINNSPKLQNLTGWDAYQLQDYIQNGLTPIVTPDFLFRIVQPTDSVPSRVCRQGNGASGAATTMLEVTDRSFTHFTISPFLPVGFESGYQNVTTQGTLYAVTPYVNIDLVYETHCTGHFLTGKLKSWESVVYFRNTAPAPPNQQPWRSTWQAAIDHSCP